MIAPRSSILLVRQSRRALFRSLTAETSAVVLVREGEKVVSGVGTRTRIAAGALGVLPARVPLTIENHPGESGRYVASALVISHATLDGSRRAGIPPGDPSAATQDDRAVAAFERAATRLDDPLTPTALQEHAVGEVLLWLAEAGIGFGPDRPVSFSDRLRGILAEAPEANWKAAEAARALATSEATFRRRLAADGTTFGDVLVDLRMTRALGLLQTTDLPVNRIALDCGYASPSRFAIRFRRRFGLAPSSIRGGRSDRIGTEVERRGTTEDVGRT